MSVGMNEENETIQLNAEVKKTKTMLFCWTKIVSLTQPIHYFCWTQPFVWKALSYVASVSSSTSSRWRQQPKRSHVHSHSFALPEAQSCGLCKLSSHAPLSGERHIFGMKDSLAFVCGFSEKAALLCLFVAWGWKPLLFCHPCHRCCCANFSIKKNVTLRLVPSSMLQTQQPQPPSVFKQWNQTLTMQKGLFSPPRCCQSPVRPPLSPFTRLWRLKIDFGRVPSRFSALPTHLSAEDKVMMICRHQFVLENCHSRLLRQKRSATRLVMFMQVKFVVKPHRSVGTFW